jgi:hypothetical protein
MENKIMTPEEQNGINNNTQTSTVSTQTTSSSQPLQSKFKQFLYNEVTLVIAIGAFLWGVFNFVSSPQQQIQSEFNKHEALQVQQVQSIISQIELLQNGDIRDLKADILENRDELVKLTNEVVKLGTIIQERIPAKK